MKARALLPGELETLARYLAASIEEYDSGRFSAEFPDESVEAAGDGPRIAAEWAWWWELDESRRENHRTMAGNILRTFLTIQNRSTGTISVRDQNGCLVMASQLVLE